MGMQCFGSRGQHGPGKSAARQQITRKVARLFCLRFSTPFLRTFTHFLRNFTPTVFLKVEYEIAGV